MLPEKVIFIGVTISLIGHLLYIRSIINGYSKPNLVSWVVWMIAPFIGVFFQLKAGATLSVLPVFMAGFGPLIIITTALLVKNAIWKVKSFDIYCGALSVVALLVYLWTNNLGISILFAILSDALAFIPTMVKAWSFPYTESPHAYLWSIFSNTLGLLIINNWVFTIYSFSVYLILANIIMVSIIYRKKLLESVSKLLSNDSVS